MKPLLFALLIAGVLSALFCALNPPAEKIKCISGHTYEVVEDAIIETYVEELRKCEE